MDLSFAPEDEEFRREIRAFIEREYDEDLRRQMAQSKNGYLDKEGQMKWMKKLNTSRMKKVKEMELKLKTKIRRMINKQELP